MSRVVYRARGEGFLRESRAGFEGGVTKALDFIENDRLLTPRAANKPTYGFPRRPRATRIAACPAKCWTTKRPGDRDRNS